MNSQTIGSKLFNVINVSLFLIIGIAMLFPYINILTLSLEPNHIAIQTGVIHLFPKEITLKAYYEIWNNSSISAAFVNSVFITVTGAVLGVLVTSMLGYGLAHEEMMGYKLISSLVLFTMMFSGGIIPSYILVKNLGLMNNLWALIIPTLITAYNTILMKVFFKNLPSSLSESAMIDGCTEIGIFFKIVLPLSAPILATVGLFYAVAKWNEFFTAVMYITDGEKKTLQVILREILIQTTNTDAASDLDIGMNVKMATAIVATVPILCVYPMLQRHFTKGIMLGAVKG